MKRLIDEVTHFFHNQSFVIVSSIDKNGSPHSACKGIIKIEPDGKIYLLDLYRGKTHDNLRHNPRVCITAIDEHKFRGYCLKGRVNKIPEGELADDIVKAWEDRITSRLTQRVLKNLRGEKGHVRHPESLLPKPKYMIVIDIEEIIDLTPHHIR